MWPIRGGRHRRPGIALVLLAFQMAQAGFQNIPPVTLATLAANVAMFLRLFRGFHYPKLGEVCVSVVHVWYQGDWKRLIYAAFFHADEWHLYYNMASFMWKGITLERRMGSARFLYVLAVFTLCTHSLLLGLNYSMDHFFHQSSYLADCAVGFSGVIFALKVLTTHYLPPGMTYIMGWLPVPRKIACWVELVVIQILIPRASFMGHLSGILVGLLFTSGPLRAIMDLPFGGWTRHRYHDDYGAPEPRHTRVTRQQSYTYHAGATGFRAREGAGLTEEEELEVAMQQSLREYEQKTTQAAIQESVRDTGVGGGRHPSAPPIHTAVEGPPPSAPQSDLEALRQRRLTRLEQLHR
ncbi:RHBDD1 [Branchiostoma lanceolatum]|uniref:RHBDD1 protein n=1 Tax=Branchiostoma lanceolatum TaxID=7740 RepID=A0A8K0EBM0_BRALA|nr:RHBDD1 [Branchiostoma lanceolatum]